MGEHTGHLTSTALGAAARLRGRDRGLCEGLRVGSFEAARRTSGGMFAGFKSSCAVLGRAVKVLGQDTAKWMKKPSSNAELGDVRLIPRN